jgi:catechol 2,3-dioxygenase-like lactoylglutathione lyase family enzyme
MTARVLVRKEDDMHAIEGVIELGVYADDLEAAEAFYGGVLGLPVLSREPDRHVFFQAGAGVLLVFRPATTLQGGELPAHGARGPTHFALGIRAESLADWRDRLAEFGVAIEREITWPRGGHSLYFRDAAGNSVELITPGVWGLPNGW